MINQTITESLQCLNKNDASLPLATLNHGDMFGANVLIRPLVANHAFIGYQIGERDLSSDLQQRENRKALDNLKQSFSKAEVKELCFDLSLEFEDLDESALHLSLFNACERRGLTGELLKLAKTKRPNVGWEFEARFKPCSEIALVVSASRKPLEAAAEDMSRLTDSCQFFLFTNDISQSSTLNQKLSISERWDDHAQTFSQFCAHIPMSKSIHFFIAGPIPLAFMFGCAFGTVHIGHKIYHYQPDEHKNYVHVGTISRDWKL